MVSEVALAKVPVPLEVHKTDVLLVTDDPAVMFSEVTDEQMLMSVPASAVGNARIVNVFEEDAVVQGAFPFAVRVMVTDPAVMSSALGV